jgi:hypothetical protein
MLGDEIRSDWSECLGFATGWGAAGLWLGIVAMELLLLMARRQEGFNSVYYRFDAMHTLYTHVLG